MDAYTWAPAPDSVGYPWDGSTNKDTDAEAQPGLAAQPVPAHGRHEVKP